MPKFRKKPVVIEAMHYDGTHERAKAICAWSGATFGVETESALVIDTLEGRMVASRGDWIIKDAADEFYPCEPDIFEATYESVEASDD